MTPQQYCLRWKYHHNNLQTMFTQLLDRGCFCDVTIACEGQTLRVHRVVLCACSTYFDSILTNCSLTKEPIILMRDCKFEDIRCLVEFMYKGEINVEHSNLSSILKTAVDLRIKGLADVPSQTDTLTAAESNGDSMIQRSRKQFAAAVARAHTQTHNGEPTPSTSAMEPMPQTSGPVIASVIASVPLGHMHHSPLPDGPDLQHSSQSTTMLHPMRSGPRTSTNNQPQPLPQQPTMAHLYPQLSHQPQSMHSPPPPVKRKRGRPPLDGEFDSYSTPKITHVEGGVSEMIEPLAQHQPLHSTLDTDSNAASMVEALLDDHSQSISDPHIMRMQQEPFTEEPPMENAEHINSQNNEVDKYYQSPEEQIENEPELGMHIECEEDTLDGCIIPKLERPDTPPSEVVVEEAEKWAVLPTIVSPTVCSQVNDMFSDDEMKEWKDVIKMNDYLTRGRRQQFWDEHFTVRVMEAIRNKQLEMKKGAFLLGVSYGTLYGRYRETYGCLKHHLRQSTGSRGEAIDSGLNSGDEPDLLQPHQRDGKKQRKLKFHDLNMPAPRPIAAHRISIDTPIGFPATVGSIKRPRAPPPRRYSVYEPTPKDRRNSLRPPKESDPRPPPYPHNFEYSRQLRRLSMQQIQH